MVYNVPKKKNVPIPVYCYQNQGESILILNGTRGKWIFTLFSFCKQANEDI